MGENLCKIIDIKANPKFRTMRLPGYCIVQNRKSETSEGGFAVTLLKHLEDFDNERLLNDIVRYQNVIIRGVCDLDVNEGEMMLDMVCGKFYGGYDGREKYIKA